MLLILMRYCPNQIFNTAYADHGQKPDRQMTDLQQVRALSRLFHPFYKQGQPRAVDSPNASKVQADPFLVPEQRAASVKQRHDRVEIDVAFDSKTSRSLADNTTSGGRFPDAQLMFPSISELPFPTN